MEDKKIVELYFERSEIAIKESHKKYGSYLYSIANNILDSREDSEECINDTYADAWNCIPPHRPSNLATFLGKITRRISIDRLRRRFSQKRGGEATVLLDELKDCLPCHDSTEREFDGRELSRIINSFVRGLPENERTIFMRRYWYMENVKLIALDLGFSESKVKSVLHRTRNKLKKILEKEGF